MQGVFLCHILVLICMIRLHKIPPEETGSAKSKSPFLLCLFVYYIFDKIGNIILSNTQYYRELFKNSTFTDI